jgi:ubiquinone/menaquinone biosynthesis C-methylase UbiE
MNKYTKMQKDFYEESASGWSIENRDPVVGSFDLHNNWVDYDKYLFKDINLTDLKSCLDFGCGPGRNIAKYNKLFSQFDGVDISKNNLNNAKKWLEYNDCDIEKTNLILCNGLDLDNISTNSYDVIMSTICFQHICVHEIRKNYFKEFYRVLKNNGKITIQMGFGSGHPKSVDYYANNYDALETNSGCDTRIEDPLSLEKDLLEIGFNNFKFYITDTGPGCAHSNWIFFNAEK